MMLAGARQPDRELRSGGLRVTGLPARTAVAEVTLYRVTKLDHATSPRAYAMSAPHHARGRRRAPRRRGARPKAPR